MIRKLTLFFIGFTCMLSANTLVANTEPVANKTNKKNTHFYPSSQKTGIVGTTEEQPFDSPSDNVFEVYMESLPSSEYKVWLTYDLYGVHDHTAVSRSINDQISVGGYFVRSSASWSPQKEQINGKWLKKGNNIIRFTIPESGEYAYQIRNLGILVETVDSKPERAIIVNQPEAYFYEDTGYIKGFVQGKDAERAKLFIAGAPLENHKSEFEALVRSPKEVNTWSVSVKAVYPDGEIIESEVEFNDKKLWNYKNKANLGTLRQMEKPYIPGKPFHISLEGTSLQLPEKALEQQQSISITALRSIDIPALDMGMVNVTKSTGGYRFLPHGTQFKKGATVSMEFDPDKIPEGYTANDIKTFYFDEATKHWVALKRDSIQADKNTIVSSTTHFTDMINGIIKVPESPETAAFTPTSMKDIKAADPSAAVVTIAPPSANNMGGANLGYPIKLPGGRQGIQPELAIQYSSGGGNDWLGLGWNLQIPSVMIETRWGVPRYDGVKETETYLLNGQQLYPVAHRGELQDRTSEKRFYPRVEGTFNRIIRHGDNPTNYWWEVTDKSGVRFFYGGTPTLGLVENSILKDAGGNIAHWALVEVRDLNDNFARYHCTKVLDVGVAGGTVQGSNIYVDRITYTGHGASEGKYEVLFTRDRELGETKRVDVTINARYGFKQVTADLLRKIEVKFNGTQIRSYELFYTTGAFYKTLLTAVSEYDAGGQLFNTHEFEYFDDVKASDGYVPYYAEENWTPHNDGVHGDFLNPINQFNDDASALSGTKSNSIGAGLAVTVGIFDGNLGSKSNTIGPKIGFSSSKSEGMLALVDINGDRLPDKVFKGDGSLKYRINQSGPDDEALFSELRDIMGVSNFAKSKTTTFSAGVEAHPLIAFIGYDRANSTTKEEIYFSDVNADKLVDIVANGVVYFNHLDANGDPLFTTDSNDTPSYVIAGNAIDSNVYTPDPNELEDMIDQFPLHDVVKTWVAPFNGVVSVTGDVALTAPAQPSGTADGVRVAIQYTGTELWNSTMAPDDFSPHTPTGVGAINVNKGDKIYFRVQSVFDGTDDQVSWDPVITYSEHTPDITNADAQPVYEFHASDDYVLASLQSLSVPIDGTITIEGNFIKPITSDDLEVQIINEATGTVIWQQTYGYAQTANDVINESLSVTAGDTFSFKVSSDTNVDWSELQWPLRLYYTASSDPDYPTVTDQNGNPLFEFHPVPNYTMFPRVLEKTLAYEATVDGMASISPLVTVGDASQNGMITFSIKKENELISKQTLTVISGVVGAASPVSVNVVTGDQLFVEFHSDQMELAESITQNQAEIVVNGGIPEIVNAGLYTIYDDISFGHLYRGWGQFTYNGNRDRANQPINESELVLDNELMNPTDPNTISDPGDLEGGYDPTKSNFIIMYAMAEDQSWKGFDNLTYVTASQISSSRLGEDDLTLASPFSGTVANGTGASGIIKITKTKTNSYALGAGVGAVSGSYSISDGYTENISDFVDMNGDGYPDIVTQSHIQYTDSRGGLTEAAVPHSLDRHRAEFEAEGFTIGGTYINAKSNNTNTTRDVVKAQIATMKRAISGGQMNAVSSENDAKTSVSVSGNFSNNEDETKHSWMDVNGDGLPDKVFQGGDVALNLGYSFAPREPWGYVEIRDGESIDYGGGIGVNFGNWSVAAGISLSRTENEANTTLQDINGDGLVDILTRSGSTLTVNLNTGNGFAPAIPWANAPGINEGASTGESANTAFTVCIPLVPPIPVAKLCFNPSGTIGHGVSRDWQQLNDLNGDGYPDVLESKKDEELKVKRSTIARTNLLKGVKRPLGASFELDYARVGNTYDLPNNIWALTTVTVHDGFDGDGADTMISTFEYEDGFYNRHERDFYGFKTVKSHQRDTQAGNSIYRTVVQEFKNNNYYEKGLLEREVMQDGTENLYTETLNSFALKDITTGANLPSTFANNDAGTAFPATVEMQKNFYEGQTTAGKTTRVTYGYDVLGNIISYTDFGDSGTADDISSSITYHNITDKYIVGTPSSITVSGSGQTYRRRETDINTLNGNLIQIRKYLENGGIATYDMDYDQYGNLTKITRPENVSGDRLFFEYAYDPEVHTYTTQVTDAYGYTSNSEYEYLFGQMLLSTDLNGQQMRYEIDDLGRITTVTGPLELAAGLPYTIAFEYHPEAEVPWALTRHYDPAHPDNDLLTSTFIDGLKRNLQMKKDGAIYTAPQGANDEVMIVSGRVTFDAFGRIVENYYPVREPVGTQGQFNSSYDIITPTRTVYDVLDRNTLTTLPDEAITKTEYTFGSDRNGQTQFSTRVTDANGIWKESYTNVRGLTTAIQELYSQGSNIWTSYTYNAINELTEVKDDQNNLITSEYDWLGRRTQVIHPDAGTTTFQYDLANNMTRKVTANLALSGGGIGYEYEFERLTKVNYPDNPQNNVTYTYGDSGAPNNRAGRIVVQEDATGAQEFFYNSLGAMVKNIRTIVVPDSELLTYTTQWTYDTWNRVTDMIYPDGETLKYSYNLGGLLHDMSGKKDGTDYNYLTQLGYDKFEQRVYLSYGNGTETFYSYEPERRRLHNMVAETATDRKMMDNIYTYDRVNNILRLQNKAEIPASNLMGGQTDYQYTYDDLYRLTSATGSHLGSNHENRYSLNMSYNSIHSITQKNQLHEFKGYDETEWSPRNKTTYNWEYQYGDTQPHAPIHIGDRAYTYDANGNQTGWTHDVSGQERQIVWDEENRIKAIADNGAVFSYVYDASNERVLKRNGGGQNVRVNGKNAGGNGGIGNYTVYVNPYVVIRSGNFTKHFYIENQRIVSKLGESSDGLLQDTAGTGIDYTAKETALKGSILKLYADLGLEMEKVDGEAGNSGNLPPGQNKDGNTNGGDNNGSGGNGVNKEAFIFYYHPDHLGSSAYLTDTNGEVYQHLEYFAFGETFLEEHGNSERTPYLFNGKELDEETGLYYYGARYYDPRTSVWQSVDPVVINYLDGQPNYGVFSSGNLNTFAYTYQNPVNLSDPSGKFPIAPILWWVGKRAAAGAIADVAVQLATEWISGGGSIADAWGRLDIDGWQVARSAGENLVKGKYSAAALSAAGDMITYMMKNDDWTWEGALMAAGEGGISSLLGDKLAGLFMRKIGRRIPASKIFRGGLENRKLAEAHALGTKYRGFKNANIEIKENNPVFDLFDNAGNIVDVTTTSARNLSASSFYRKLNRLSGMGDAYGERTLQIYVQRGQYTSQQLKDLKTKLNSYISNNNLNVNISIDQIR